MPYIDWMGKDDVKDHHKSIPYKTIDCKEEIGDKDSQNMIIKGDNLLALKSLLPYYASSVKMIYIDPPYNTGNTSWVYNDNMDSPLIKKWLNDTVNAEDLSRSDKWLCMMYPRLKLLRELLKDDGIIFISIDDAEVAQLRLICDEIFGKDNFVGEIIRKTKSMTADKNTGFNFQHEYLIIYAKEKKKIFLLGEDKDFSKYRNPDNDNNGAWVSGDPSAKSGSDSTSFKITNPYTNKVDYPPLGRYWAFSKDTLERYIKNGRVKFKKEHTEKERGFIFKRYLNELKADYNPVHSLFGIENDYMNQIGTKELQEIFNEDIFSNPKPSIFIKKLIQYTMSSSDIILDSFAGSGTTAQAVLEKNKEDGGNRKFILIETLDYAKDITAERVKRVIKGYNFTGKDKTTLFEKKLTTTQILKPQTMEKISKDVTKILEDEKENYTKLEKTFKENTLKIEGVKDIKSFKEGIGGGFKYCELSHDIFDEFGELNQKLTFEQIAKHIYFVEFKRPIKKDEITSPFVGSYNHKYLYFYEKEFLKRDMQKLIKEKDDYKQIIVYTQKTSISDDELKDNNIIIRYIPYDIKDN